MDQPAARLEPARRRVLADEVADSIRHAIVAGELSPGQRLIEDELASQLGVSRGPVREALARLGLEGLVVTERHRGATVAHLSAQEVAEISSLRTTLERLAAEWACRNATEEELAHIEQVLDRIDTLPRPLAKDVVANLDLDFHDAVFLAAHHDRLYRAWQSVRSQIFLFFLQGNPLPPDFARSWRSDHEALLVALRSGKRPQAVKAVERHASGTYHRIVAEIPDD